jgi:thiamine pyrophosphate-dependent acetolactate synthase large subunit-like protein
MDIAKGVTAVPAFDCKAFITPKYGPAPGAPLATANQLIEVANPPVLFLRMRAVGPDVKPAIRGFLHRYPIPVAGTFQDAGAVSKYLAHLFCGRRSIPESAREEVASLEILFQRGGCVV